LAWKIEFSGAARKELSKLDRSIALRIISFLEERVAEGGNPRAIGKALTDSLLGEFWKYRVGDWRLICSIDDERVVIQVLRIGNRREVYRDKA